MTTRSHSLPDGIAVIGISGRYPGASNLDQFWELLKAGKETVTQYTTEELLEAGFDPDVINDPNFVKARPVYKGPMEFDAPFFGYTPREAEIIDPQQRVFLETAWEAMEDAGYDPQEFPGPIGLYGGSGMTYYLFGLLENPRVMASMGGLAVTTSNEKDYFATRVGYKLNLRGPCVTVQTACSTALVGISFACQSLLTHQTDLALAGGASISPNEMGGYYYTEGGIVSHDGHTRTFDAKGQGTIFGSGSGVVVLKRLREAIQDGDNIHAVIRGYGINNDGSSKIGFTAPAVDGQAAVCLDAFAMAGIHPDSVDYLECHGTATPMGDLVEITALTKAFRSYTAKKQFCAVGSVKTNIGHMDAAAGVAGFTKAVLTLKHGLVPPNLHFETPNPEIDFANSPFFVNTKLTELHRNGTPLRAGISSFGVGGTNTHILLEEAPALPPTSESRPLQIIGLSAKSDAALDRMAANLATFLEAHPEVPLADVAYTLRKGRRRFIRRAMTVAGSREQAITALHGEGSGQVFRAIKERDATSVVFLFPGQGAQHPGMAQDIYKHEPVFAREIDRCCEVLQPLLGLDLRTLLNPSVEDFAAAEERLKQTHFAQSALFVVEYALAKLWTSWGVNPEAMIGHSIGEYVAACLAGVFTLEDALKLVAERGRLMQSMAPGAMLGVLLDQQEILALFGEFNGISIAAINAPGTTVVSGPIDAIARLESSLEKKSVPVRRLHTSHAFHSAMMEPMLAPFRAAVAATPLSEPKMRYLSNVSGTWVAPGEATDPEYWVRHVRQAVRFSDNIAAVLGDGPKVLLEVGPGRVLGSLVTQHTLRTQEHPVLASLPSQKGDESSLQWIMTTAGRLWLEGTGVDPDAFYAGETRRRVSLPTYSFDHENYFVEVEARAKDETQISHRKISDIGKWFHYPTWKRALALPEVDLPSSGCALLFTDEAGLGERLSVRLEAAGWDVIRVRAGETYSKDGPISFTIHPGEREHYERLLEQITRFGLAPTLAIHLWSVTLPDVVFAPELTSYGEFLDRGFISMMNLAPNLSAAFSGGAIRVLVAGNELYDVSGNELAMPTKTAILGPCRAALAECPNLNLHVVDIEAPRSERNFAETIEQLLSEAFADRSDEVIAYRGGYRWLQSFDPLKLDKPAEDTHGLREGGVYLVTGGFGGIGLVMAEAIAAKVSAKLALFGRSALPPRAMWRELSEGSDLTAEKVRRLLRMEELGAELLCFSADVGDLEQMRAAVARVEAELGPINGVFHSAGVAGGGVMLLKTRGQMEEVLRPKIAGTLVLEELMKDKPLDFFHLCSSLNSFLGEGGISDYIGANAFIDAFASSRRRAKNPPIAIQWDSWEDVGMVAEGWFNGVKIDWDKRSIQQLDHPLFTSLTKHDQSLIYGVELDPAKHWFIGEHVLMGTPTLVGTTNLQWARSAFIHVSGGAEREVELRDVLFLAPLVLQPGTTCEVEVALDPQGDAFGFAVRSRRTKGSAWVVHALGKVLEAPAHAPVKHDLPSILARCAPQEVQVDTKFDPNPERAPFLQFGDRWLNLHSTAYGKNEALGEFRLKEQFHGDLEVFGMHPAVLDRATGFAVFKAGAEGAHYLPFAYNRVRISQSLAGVTYSHVRYEPGDEFVGTNVALFDDTGRELMLIEGYEVKRVPQNLLDSNDAELVASGGTSASAAIKAEPAKSKIAARILSADGADVLSRLLTLKSTPQIAVACRDLRAVQAEIRGVLGARSGTSDGGEQGKQTLYPRPSLATSYVEPRNELEQALADIWGDMLGINQVGVFDDFLELGGNSLLGIQIASRIRADFEIELSVATFYKSPTISTLAESILETLQAGLTAEELAGALDEIEAQNSGLAAESAVAV